MKPAAAVVVLRKALRLTQSDSARKVGSSPASIAHYEYGSRRPDAATVARLCRTAHQAGRIDLAEAFAALVSGVRFAWSFCFLECALLLCPVVGWAQVLQILPSPATRKGSGSFQIMLVSPAGKEPLAVQWTVSVPQGVAVSVLDMEIASAAKSAGKSLTCAATPGSKKQRETGSTHKCILVGGQTQIPNGPLAAVRLTVQPGSRSVKVLLHDVLGVAADMKQLDIPDAEGTIPAK